MALWKHHVNLRRVSTKLNKYVVFTMQTFKQLSYILFCLVRVVPTPLSTYSIGKSQQMLNSFFFIYTLYIREARNILCIFFYINFIGNHKRLLWNNGHLLMWNHISDIFFTDLEHGLHLLPRITTDHINLTSYSVTRVNLAAQVLSSCMVCVLKEFGPVEAVGTAEFCKKMDNFFDCFNVRITT